MTDLDVAMICPKCDSRDVALVHVAYSKSVRGSEWGISESDFAYILRPPEEHSVIFWPLIIGTLAFLVAAGMYLLMGDIVGTPRNFLDEQTRSTAFRLGRWAFSTTAAIRCLLAIRFNLYRFPHQFEFWKNQVVCHRCSHQFPSTRLATFQQKTGVNS